MDFLELVQNIHSGAFFEGWGNLILPVQAFDWTPRNAGISMLDQQLESGGEGGIRTPGTVPRTLDFESSAFNRARPPLRVSGHSIEVSFTFKFLLAFFAFRKVSVEEKSSSFDPPKTPRDTPLKG